MHITIGGIEMAKKGHSEPNLFGGYTHYDDHGRKTGRSDPGIFGGYTNYDAKGHKIGHSEPGLFGGMTHYDNHGHKVGRSDPGLFGSYSHYDAAGHKTGTSDPELFGGYRSTSSDGCYVATCVYGSYDCPEVWTLRRFRDQVLGRRVLGRLFIRTYYALSPTLVHLFGNTAWFRAFFRSILDPFVARLRAAGIQSTPYKDRDWRCFVVYQQ